MANKTYISSSQHRFLSAYPSLTSPRRLSSSSSQSHLSTSPRRSSGSTGSPPPEFSYDVNVIYQREHQSAFNPRDVSLKREDLVSSNPILSPKSFGANHIPSSPVRQRSFSSPVKPRSSSLNMAYSSVQEFPYGLSGVQMPTYNFGSELYNYVSNGFPRKSRMCTYCNKVFTRSTTRRYHERRCPLLRASNSLAKNEENNSNSTSLAALKEQQSQRQKESPGNGYSSSISKNVPSNPAASLPRTLSSSHINTTTVQTGALSQLSPPLSSLHPAYPTSYPKGPGMVSASSRSPGNFNYPPHPYSSHFYNSLSAAALASTLDHNSSSLKHVQSQTHHKDNDSNSLSWNRKTSISESPSKVQDHLGVFSTKLGSALAGNGPLSLSKGFTPESVADMTARYCADFTLRTQPPVFPASSLRAPPHSPPSPEPGETNMSKHYRYEEEREREINGRESPVEANRAISLVRDKMNASNNGHCDNDNKLPPRYRNLSSSSLTEIENYRRHNSVSSPNDYREKNEVTETDRPTYMKIEPLDEDEEEELEDEEDEEEVEEDEEQFKMDTIESEAVENACKSLNYKGTPYNPNACQFCKEVFNDILTRKAHESLHVQKKLFACCICTQSFHCAYSLRIHILRRHKNGPFRCKYCFFDYGPASSLRNHLIKEHSLPKTELQSLKYFALIANCSSPSSPTSIISNNAVSEGEHDDYPNSRSLAFKKYRRSADFPDTRYSFSDDNSKSLLLSPNNSRNCDSVSKAAAANGSEAAQPNDEETETCKICSKSFAKSYIRLHERSHADQKPYECPICNKRFGYKNNMKSHMKLHQGLKPYQCQICGARFTRGSTLRRHGRRHNISSSAMLDYVLYDQHGGVNGSGGALSTLRNHAVGLSMASRTASSSSISANVGAMGSKNVLYNEISARVLNKQSCGNNSTTVPLSLSSSTPLDSPLAISTKHQRNMFGAMPSLISGPSLTQERNDDVSDKRFNSNMTSLQQRSPNSGGYHQNLANNNNSNSIHNSPNSKLNSPRHGGTNGHLTATNPMVGGLAAVAAANLFGYTNPVTGAPQLYPFYANPLMAYPPYTASLATQAIQSDALNLSMNKRRSDDRREDGEKKDSNDRKIPRLEIDDHRVTQSECKDDIDKTRNYENALSYSNSKDIVKGKYKSPHYEPDPFHRNEKAIKRSFSSPSPPPSLATERNSPSSSSNTIVRSNTINSPTDVNPKLRNPTVKQEIKIDKSNDKVIEYPQTLNEIPTPRKDLKLKVDTEEFGAQVNICCPSPRVQSSTSNSPVGSSSGPDCNLHSQTSPHGRRSGSNSPADSNSMPSPTDTSTTTLDGTNGQDEMLVSLISSGKLFHCSHCDIYFTEYVMFRLHQNYHQSDAARPFLCAVCMEDCKDKTYFTVHLSEHLGLGPKSGLLS